MCGRFRQSRKKEILAEHFDAEPDADWHASFNIAPTQNIAVIRQHLKEPKRVGSTMRWGLIPFWTLLAKYHITRWPNCVRAEVRVGAGRIPHQ
jgi:putative SOS response-associated peptidase YedK